MMKDLWSGLVRERANMFQVWHLVGLFIPVLLVFPGVAESMGLAPRTLLIIGRSAIPLLAVSFVPTLIMRDVSIGTIEPMAASTAGLPRVWVARITLFISWATVLLVVLLVPLELRSVTRHGLVAEFISSWIDVLLFSAASSWIAHRVGSETGGIVGGITLWLVGVLLGIAPPSGVRVLGFLTPLSAYFFGSIPALFVNRLIWALVAFSLLGLQAQKLDQPQTLLTQRE